MTAARIEVDFDHYSPEYAAKPQAMNRQMLAEAGPIAYSQHHGGFWIALGYDVVNRIARDDAAFTSTHDLPNGSSPNGGINHPPAPFKLIPLELDPPHFNQWRRPMGKHFGPPAVDKWRPKMQEYATWCLDQVIERGSLDFVTDFANPVPSLLTMELLGIPITRWQEFAKATHAQAALPGGSPEKDQAQATFAEIVQSVLPVAQQRREQPKEDDFLSRMVHLSIDGKAPDDAEILSICLTFVGGGVDTTTSLVSSALHYLGTHPGDRDRLINDPSLLANACEEFLRYYSPVQILARTATRDVEIAGQSIKKGERVLLSWAAANMDPAAFDEPETIKIDRFPNRHAALGFGVHKCIGSHHARADFEIMLSEVLRRMPDYRIDENGVRTAESAGVTWGYVNLPATFTPGPRSGRVSSLDTALATGA